MELYSLIPILSIILVVGPLSALGFSHTPLGRAVVKRLSGTANASAARYPKVTGCIAASGSWTFDQRSLWHCRPATKRDLERWWG